ncbi:hypothetical protein [Rhodococcus sp. FH8]|uniref:hypothetical protein n=1 Tax=Rhodococcus sp. FH8 TaxID=1761013 RepID=UPI001C4E6A6D|nr:MULTISPECIES: hypothetical protein [Rhodococcus]
MTTWTDTSTTPRATLTAGLLERLTDQVAATPDAARSITARAAALTRATGTPVTSVQW